MDSTLTLVLKSIFDYKNCVIQRSYCICKMLTVKSLCLRSIPLLRRIKTHEVREKALQSLSPISDISRNYFTNSSANKPVFNNIRHKSKKAAAEDSDDEEDFLADDKSLTKDSKVMKFSTTSLRTDAVLKSALGVARNKIEQLFFESKIRVNGRKILKKSAPVRLEYEIDVIKHVSPKNPNHLYIARVEVLNIVAKEETIQFTVRRFKNLLIDNYEKDPYKSGETQPNQ